ncbi:uncharacterized protein LOC110687703 [Chenopodium quinoa]|uniref:uncharacterized protein LOC110687703 n=1 Tax=Chenopodium quinoa TaxID=63459 RepID=UPI000B780681|nr:uncharacterized protein LOC110687703 [Chenopodium quinoa]
MTGGKDGESSKKSKGKGKAPMVIDYSDEEMEEAEAHDLGATKEPAFSQPRDQIQQHSELPVLDPTTLWFDDNKVRSAVSGTLARYYRDPWRNFGEKQYTWAPQLNEHVKITFERKFATRLRDMFHTVTHKMNGAKPGWLNKEVHKKMMDIVATDPTYKKRLAQNRKNRRGGSMENAVEPTHYQGSMSAIQHAKRMAEKNQGQLPTAPELFLKTHFKDVPGKGTVPANTKAKQIAEAYQKKIEETSTQGIRKSPNELYFETVGGRNKKGRVKGLGQSAQLYYGNKMG